MKKNSEDDSDDSDNIQEPHNSDDDVTVDGDFFSKNNQNNHVWSNDSDDFLVMCDPPYVEADDISEANYQNLLRLVLLKIKKHWNFPTTNAADVNFEVRYETAYSGRNN